MAGQKEWLLESALLMPQPQQNRKGPEWYEWE